MLTRQHKLFQAKKRKKEVQCDGKKMNEDFAFYLSKSEYDLADFKQTKTFNTFIAVEWKYAYCGFETLGNMLNKIEQKSREMKRSA